METTQISMMPMASSAATAAVGTEAAGMGGGTTAAGQGFGTLLGQTLEMLHQGELVMASGSTLPGEVTFVALAEEVPQGSEEGMQLASLLIDASSIDVDQAAALQMAGKLPVPEPQGDLSQATSGEEVPEGEPETVELQERAQQLASFLQAAMLVPLTVADVEAPVVPETAVEQVSLEAGTAAQGVTTASAATELQLADSAEVAAIVADQGQVDVAALAIEQEHNQRVVAIQPSAPQVKMSTALQNEQQRLNQQGAQPAAEVQLASPAAGQEMIKASQAGSVLEGAAAREGRSGGLELPAGPKVVASPAAPVRFAQQPDVVAATLQPDQQRQQEQSLTGQQGKAPSEEMLMSRATASAGEVAPFEVQTVSVAEVPTPSGHGLAMTVQQRHGALQDVPLAEAAKTTPDQQVMRQVSDRLATHEMKQGNDQISLKLSPEHLGNLQLNLRMEDQQVRVEIVAEHRAVREALLQQVDQLKESLSRQNIKMESFDVTTANNGGLSQQQNGDWRQTASERRPLYQQQYGAGKVAAGAAGAAGVGMQYFAPQYQSTLDVRF